MQKILNLALVILTAAAIVTAVTGCDEKGKDTPNTPDIPKVPAAPKDHPAH